MAIEEVFDIEISDEAAGKILTVGDMHRYVVEERTRLGRPEMSDDIALDLLRNVICFRLGVKPEEVVPEAEFVRDLRAD